MGYTFKFRRGTAQQWIAADPILAEGEPGIEVDKVNGNALKTGDGLRKWSELPYILTDNAMKVYINEQLANAEPVSDEDKAEIVDTVLSAMELPDLTLLWENAITGD